MKVLIIEDDLALYSLMSEYLAVLGYEVPVVGTTSTVEEGLTKIGEHLGAGAILLDMNFTEERQAEGLEIARQIGPEMCQKVLGISDRLSNKQFLNFGVKHIPGKLIARIKACLEAIEGKGKCFCPEAPS